MTRANIHTRTVASALIAALETTVNDPSDTPHIGSADIEHISGIANGGSFELALTNGNRFRVDVVRID